MNPTRRKSLLARRGLVAVVLALGVLFFALQALQGAPGDPAPLIIEGAWARAALSGGNTAVYMRLTNTGDEPLRLVGAASEAAAAVELHETVITPDHVMQMRPIQGVELPPGETVEFRSGGLHVMLLGLRETLREGDELPLELLVEGMAPISISVPVSLLGGDDHDHHHDHHDHGAHEHHALLDHEDVHAES